MTTVNYDAFLAPFKKNRIRYEIVGTGGIPPPYTEMQSLESINGVDHLRYLGMHFL